MPGKKRGRQPGVPNYSANVLLDVVDVTLPVTNEDWITVAKRYRKAADEFIPRNYADVKRHFYGVLCKGKKNTKEGSDPVQMQRIARARKIESQILQKQGNLARIATRNDDCDDVSMDHDDDDFSCDRGDSEIENEDDTNTGQNTKRPRVLREDTHIGSPENLQLLCSILGLHQLRHEMAMQNMRHFNAMLLLNESYSFTNRILMTILMMYYFAKTNSPTNVYLLVGYMAMLKQDPALWRMSAIDRINAQQMLSHVMNAIITNAAENGVHISSLNYFKTSSTSLPDISNDNISDISSLGGSERSSLLSRSPCKKRSTFIREGNLIPSEKLLKHFD